MRSTSTLGPIALLAIPMALAACVSDGVGDPCVPRRPPLSGVANEHHCPDPTSDTGCFVGSEVYIETRSLQCRTRVCLAYGWDESASIGDPAERAAHVYCTRHCERSGEDPQGDCPEGFVCELVTEAGEPGLRGSYCVRAGSSRRR